MWHKKIILLRLDILLLLINATPDLILGLKDVSVTVPTAVKKGDNALLICNYDMESDTLYSVKWYKGRREFYRYTPKENPAMKTFTASGINVERTLSNQSHVVLSSIQLNNSGKFSCEVSADAPSFHTVIVSGDMEVVEVPEQKPSLTGVHSRYRIGDTIIGNCTSYNSKPAANLTWTINDIPALPHQTKVYPITKNPTDNLEISVAELNLLIGPHHFIHGKLKLKCIARIHGIYEQDSEKIVEEDRPRILASGRSPDVSLFPYDQQSDAESNEQNELYLTHYKDIASSASATTTSSSSSFLLHLQKKYNIGRKFFIFYSTLEIFIRRFLRQVTDFDIIFYGIIFLIITIIIIQIQIMAYYRYNINEFLLFFKIIFNFNNNNNLLKFNQNIFKNTDIVFYYENSEKRKNNQIKDKTILIVTKQIEKINLKKYSITYTDLLNKNKNEICNILSNYYYHYEMNSNHSENYNITSLINLNKNYCNTCHDNNGDNDKFKIKFSS